MDMGELAAVFLLGGGIYGAIELLWRGRTHWTMLLLGGTCFTAMYRIACREGLCWPLQALWSAGFITAAEFVTGAAVNGLLGWDVWDYRDRPGALWGLICPEYSLRWLLLSVPGCALARALARSVFHRL